MEYVGGGGGGGLVRVVDLVEGVWMEMLAAGNGIEKMG